MSSSDRCEMASNGESKSARSPAGEELGEEDAAEVAAAARHEKADEHSHAKSEFVLKHQLLSPGESAPKFKFLVDLRLGVPLNLI